MSIAGKELRDVLSIYDGYGPPAPLDLVTDGEGIEEILHFAFDQAVLNGSVREGSDVINGRLLFQQAFGGQVSKRACRVLLLACDDGSDYRFVSYHGQKQHMNPNSTGVRLLPVVNSDETLAMPTPEGVPSGFSLADRALFVDVSRALLELVDILLERFDGGLNYELSENSVTRILSNTIEAPVSQYWTRGLIGLAQSDADLRVLHAKNVSASRLVLVGENPDIDVLFRNEKTVADFEQLLRVGLGTRGDRAEHVDRSRRKGGKTKRIVDM